MELKPHLKEQVREYLKTNYKTDDEFYENVLNSQLGIDITESFAFNWWVFKQTLSKTLNKEIQWFTNIVHKFSTWVNQLFSKGK